MISNKMTAIQVSNRILEVNRLLNEVVALTEKESPLDEVNYIKRVVGYALGELLLEIANPIYKTHPDIKPDQLNFSE